MTTQIPTINNVTNDGLSKLFGDLLNAIETDSAEKIRTALINIPILTNLRFDGMTPLALAARDVRMESVKMLLAMPDIEVETKCGIHSLTALEYALANDKLETAELFRDKLGADVYDEACKTWHKNKKELEVARGGWISESRYEHYALTLRRMPSESLRKEYEVEVEKAVRMRIDSTLPTPSEKEHVVARKLWSDMVSSTYQLNQKNDVRGKVLQRLRDIKVQNPEVVYAKCLDFLRNQTTIVVAFNAENFRGDLQWFQTLNMWEKDNRGRISYSDVRKKTENGLFNKYPDALKKAFLANSHAQPRYGRLHIHGKGGVPTGYSWYGNSFIVFKDSVKFNALFSPGDSLHHRNHTGKDYTLCTLHHLEQLLVQVDANKFQAIVARVTSEVSSSYVFDAGHGFDDHYVEAFLPAIDFTDPNLVEHIYIEKSELRLSDADAGVLGKSPFPVTYASENPYPELVKKFTHAIQTDNGEVVKDMLVKSPSLVKTSDSNDIYPIHLAAKSGSIKVLSVFAEMKVSFTLKNSRDESALDLAVKNSQHKAAKLIEMVLATQAGKPYVPVRKQAGSVADVGRFSSAANARARMRNHRIVDKTKAETGVKLSLTRRR